MEVYLWKNNNKCQNKQAVPEQKKKTKHTNLIIIARQWENKIMPHELLSAVKGPFQA
jgi:hypothetical protein